MAAYVPTTQGGDYTNPTTGNFAGTAKDPSGAPLGLPAEWKNAVVVMKPARAPKSPAEQRRTWTVDFGTPAQLQTLDQMLLTFDTAPPSAAQTEALQTLLWKAGFYGSDKTPKFTPGEKDEYTRDAFTQALKEASRTGVPFADFLDERVAARTSALGGDFSGSQRAPFSPTVSSPTDVRATLQAAAQKVLGADLPPDKLQQFIAEFQAQQVAAQKGAYDTAATGGISVAAPDVSSYALDAAKRADPIKADSRTAVQVASVIQKMMSGGTNG